MKANISQKIKIGIFTIAGILLFVVGIFLIGSKKNMFNDTFLIYGTFRNVGGLEIGNNIRFAGINVGTVEDINIVSDTTIRIDMRMQTKVKPFLKADALASIGSDGLMGDKLITITSGSANEVRLLGGGSRIRTVNPVDFEKVLAKFTNVADNAEIITRELAGMAVQISTGHGSISSLLYTDKLSKSLEGTANNAEHITASLSGIASQVQAGKGSIGSLIYTDTLSNRLDKAVSTVQQAAYGFSENMKALQGNIFFRGYYKRKAKEGNKGPNLTEATATTDSVDADLSEHELEELIAEAQKALEAKRKK